MATMDDALRTFVAEGRELLEQMEESLLQIEQSPDNADLINAIFRAAHTIKGSAGIFGIDHIVRFTHVAESLLDKLRGGLLKVNSTLVAVLLSAGDHIATLLDHVDAGSEPDAETMRAGDALAEKLRALIPKDDAAPSSPSVASVGDGVTHEASADDLLGAASTDLWHISARFHQDVLRNGLDPLAIVRYLSMLGVVEQIVTITEQVPALDDIDPESCYLGYEIAFRSNAEKAAIESAFEFVSEDSRVRILPPHSKISEYRHLINDLPDDDFRLGDILVRCGTLTRAELEEALLQQAAMQGTTTPPLGEVLVKQKVVQPAVVDAALDRQKQVRDNHASDTTLIRVNAAKLDEHINLIGELIIASAGTSLIAQHINVPELAEAAARLSRLVEEVRDSALTLRMVQIGATFTKFQRVVRDVSAELKKDIHLEISGAETELDKTVVEKIGDPLTHLVRNSMDHGIESAEVRLAKGKSSHGTIHLNAYHDSGSIVIEVSDDGGGLDKERILAKAIERGIVKPEQQLSENEIHNLIFEAGLSTAQAVNNLSGRGVGMDVVRRNITALRGSIDIESKIDVGTTIRIRLPLTLAIIDGFLVTVGSSSFVVPLDMVVECIELSSAELNAAQGRDHLNLRGEVLPFIRLKNLFDIGAVTTTTGSAERSHIGSIGQGSTKSSVALTSEGAAALAGDPELAFLLNPVQRENIVVVQFAGHRAGLVVENLLGEFQTVIRPLGNVFNGLQGIAGFTILGSGQVALILDVPGLVRRVATRDSRRNQRSSVLGASE